MINTSQSQYTKNELESFVIWSQQPETVPKTGGFEATS
jgi:hypothetical protein